MNASPSNLRWFFSPSVLYFVGFIFPFLLVFIGFSNEVNLPSEKTLKVIVLGIIGFYLGVAIVFLYAYFFRYAFFEKTKGFLLPKVVVINDEKNLFGLLVILFLISISCLWFEYIKLGALPLLSSDVETLRFKLQVNGYVHLIAISSGFVSFLFFAFILFSENKLLKKWSYLIILVGIVSLTMTANRMDFIYPIILMIILYVFYTGNFFSIKVFGYIFVILFIFIFLNIFRSSGYSSDYVQDNIYGIGDAYSVNSMTLFLYPFYMTLTYSFEMMGKLVDQGVEGVTGGLYTFFAFYSLMPGPEKGFGEFKNEVLGIDFYAELTSTYLSNFYVDFGVFGVFFLSFLYGVFVQIFWETLRVSRRFVVFYAVISVPLLFSFYVYYYIYFYAIYQLFLVWLFTFFLREKEINN